MNTFNTLPTDSVVAALKDPVNRSMRDVMRRLGLNVNSSSASTKLAYFAQEHGIALDRFTAGRKLDLAGRCFGKLTVLCQTACQIPRQRAWLCKCECGKRVVYTTGVLLSSRTRHCGCGQYRAGQEHFNWTGFGEISGGYWSQLKQGAKARHLAFRVTLRYVWNLYTKQSGLCALSGVPILFGKRGKLTASLDRIGQKRGYVPGNVQWVHKVVNMMKGKLSDENFVAWAGKIAKAHEHRRIVKTKSASYQ